MLVGRDRELKVVDALVAGARLGTSGVLTLTGEAGIGKTALLGYAASTADGVRILRCAGNEAEQDVPFGGLAQLLRPTSEDLDRIPAPQAQALAVALALRPGQAGRAADRFAVGAAMLSLLTRYSEDSPVGLIVDDAHWLDRASGEAIAFAARRLLADPVFVLVAARSEVPCVLTSAGLPQWQLAGISQRATATLIRASGSSRDLAGRLHEATGGNPLAVLELARDPSRLASVPPGSPLPVPAALTGWFAARVEGLDGDTRTAVLLTATAGSDLTVIARACQARGISITALAAAEAAGLLRIDADHVEFAHPLIRSAVYAMAGPAERRGLHATVAAVLPEPDVDRRAWHRCEAALGPDDEVAAELDAAGRRANARGAYAVCATAYERAARLSVADADRARRFLDAGEAAWRAGDSGSATAALSQALAFDRTPLTRVRAQALQGEIAARCGSLEEAKQVLWSAADEITAIDPGLAVSLLSAVINSCFYLGDARTALAAGAQIEQLLEANPANPAVVGTMAMGMARVLAGQPGAGQIRAAVQLAAADPAVIADPAQATWLLLGPMWLRESGLGRQLVDAVVEEWRASSALGALPHLLFHVARDDATTDHWARAAACYTEAIELARELGQSTEVATSLAGLTWLEARMGRSDDAQRHSVEALELCGAQQIHLGRAWVEFGLGELALATGDIDAAVERLSGLSAWLDEIGVLDPDLSPIPELVEALVRSGRAAQARPDALVFLRRATDKGQPWALARAARAQGLLCPAADVDRHFTTALAHHTRTLDAFEEARTRLAFGARLRRSRRRVESRVQLRRALVMFEHLGARLWADETARELSAAGSPVGRRGANDLDQCTPRELQIALLLAEGRTTREAAAALFLSPKTVEYHLRHVYTKLEIGSRAELAARFGRNGHP
jgi:DNA-binding CsgD family transcriptional regulator/tetratricopeptide (TPR) repeat protein